MTSYSAGIRICRLLGVVFLATIFITPPPAGATEANSEHWSEWKALASGYMARRKVPARINKKLTERRAPSVQEKLVNVEQVKEHLLTQATISATTTTSVELQQQLSSVEQQIQQLVGQNAYSLTSHSIWQNAVWLHTGQAGLYSVPIADLAAQLGKTEKRIRRKAKKGRLTLTNGGLPVSWFYDEATDALLFAGDSFTTFYTDQNAYKLKSGLYWSTQTMEIIDGAPAGSTAAKQPYIDTLHFEKEPDSMYSTWTVATEPDADYWFWDYLYGGYKDQLDIPLVIPHPAPEGTAHFSITMRGWTDLEPGDEHQVYAELNGQSIGAMISWDAFEEAVLEADVDQTLLNTDGNNTLTLHNSYAAGTHPGEWLDQIDVTYSRMPVADNNMLWLHGVIGGDQTVTGFTSEDLLVIQDPSATAAMLGDVEVEDQGDGTWDVTFTTQAGADYLVADRSATKTAVLSTDNAAHLAWRYNAAEYLIIAPRELAGTAEAMAAYQEDRFDFVKIVWLDDIYNEFSHGRVDPTAITRFMKRTERWWVTPSYVLLVGKGSLDEKNRMGYSDSFLPVLMASTPWALAASDARLLGTETDPTRFAIGRIPVTSDSEGMAYVEKLIRHDAAPAEEELFKAVLVADNPDEAGDFHGNADLLADQLTDSLGFTDVTKLYHPQDNVHDALVLSATWEKGFVSYDGHGSAARVGDYQENFLSATDAEALHNTRYPVFSALTCAVADDTLPGTRSLAGALVLNPAGGAVAALAPTGLSLDADAQLLGSAFVDTLFAAGNDNTVGDALLEATLQTQGAISDFMPKVYEIVGDPSVFTR